MLNGIVFVLRTGCRWEDMPKEYGNYKTAHNLSVIYEVSNRGVFGWLKMRFRKISVRYEVKAFNFKAFLDFAIFFSNFKIVRF